MKRWCSRCTTYHGEFCPLVVVGLLFAAAAAFTICVILSHAFAK